MRREKTEISAGFLLFSAVVLFLGDLELLVILYLAAAIHETAHIAALKAVGAEIYKVRFYSTGLVIDYGGEITYLEEIVCALAGPAISISAALIFSLAEKEWMHAFVGMNLLLGLFNLLPFSALDGGRALSMIYKKSLGPDKADKIIMWSDILSAVIICGAVITINLKESVNFALVAATAWMCISCCKSVGDGVKSKK